MISDNPNARRTYDGEHPTPEQVRAIVRYEFQEAVRLRYGLDDALERTADAVHAAFPAPPAETHEDALYWAEEERGNALLSLDEAEETIRSLRAEIQRGEEAHYRLQAELDEANYRITELAKDYL